MAKTYFDFGAAANGSGTPNNPKNSISGFTFVAGDEYYFRRGTTFTGAFSLVAGLPGKRTKYGAWYNPDGTDDLSKAKPIFNLTTGISTFSSTNKDNVDISSLDIRVVFASATSDTAAVFLGSNASITNCNVDSNLGCVAAFNKSNIGIYYNTLNGVKVAGTQNNNVVIVSSSLAADNAVIVGNKVTFNSGGGSQSHGIRAEGSGTPDLTNLVITDNEVSPPAGTTYVTNLTAQGIRMQRCPGAKVMRNNVHGMLSGVFLVGGGTPISVYFGYNNMSDNLNFGIHLTTDTNGCVIEYNTCSRNGTNNTGASAYGRGIELSSSAGTARCANHIVRFNVCDFNKNYGGPNDNGSEGCGIGLDDGTMGCLVYGNFCRNNEGNGVQYYGGNSNVTWTDTGNNNVVANYFENNCTASFVGRRTGGTQESAFIAHVALTSTYGSKTYVANNIFVGGKLGISVTNNCTNFEISNNIFKRVANCIQFDGNAGNCYNNVFFKDSLSSINKYCTMVVGGALVVFSPLAFTGVNDYTFDPLLSANYKPVAGSPCIAAGRPTTVFKDAVNKQFKSTPSIGMYEWYPATSLPLHV